jgi:hypothetical protein
MVVVAVATPATPDALEITVVTISRVVAINSPDVKTQ